MQDESTNIVNEALERILSETQTNKLPEEFVTEVERMQALQLYYNYAIREVRTKLEILNDELAFKTSRNPIEAIESRVKTPASIVEKLRRKKFPLTVDSIYKNLHDVAGVRVICSFIEDIYDVAEMFLKQDDITLIETKDYIKNPKENGYRSLHLIVEVPVYLSESIMNLKVEVQIRTMAMDFWAALEHQANYKKGMEEMEGMQELVTQLTECANIINETDMRMQDIYHRIKKLQYGAQILERSNLNTRIIGTLKNMRLK